MLLRTFVYAAVGFVSGCMLSMFVLVFAGKVPNGPSSDLSQMELERRSLAIILAIVVGTITAILAIMGGKKKLSRVWMYFVIAFGVIAIVPVWPSKSGYLLPLATPYVNFGFQAQDLWLLTLHSLSAGVVAYTLRNYWSFMPQASYKNDDNG